MAVSDLFRGGLKKIKFRGGYQCSSCTTFFFFCSIWWSAIHALDKLSFPFPLPQLRSLRISRCLSSACSDSQPLFLSTNCYSYQIFLHFKTNVLYLLFYRIMGFLVNFKYMKKIYCDPTDNSTPSSFLYSYSLMPLLLRLSSFHLHVQIIGDYTDDEGDYGGQSGACWMNIWQQFFLIPGQIYPILILSWYAEYFLMWPNTICSLLLLFPVGFLSFVGSYCLCLHPKMYLLLHHQADGEKRTAFPLSINIEKPSFICLDLHLFCSPLFLIPSSHIFPRISCLDSSLFFISYQFHFYYLVINNFTCDNL
jgi:hypothetical protein